MLSCWWLSWMWTWCLRRRVGPRGRAGTAVKGASAGVGAPQRDARGVVRLVGHRHRPAPSDRGVGTACLARWGCGRHRTPAGEARTQPARPTGSAGARTRDDRAHPGRSSRDRSEIRLCAHRRTATIGSRSVPRTADWLIIEASDLGLLAGVASPVVAVAHGLGDRVVRCQLRWLCRSGRHVRDPVACSGLGRTGS